MKERPKIPTDQKIERSDLPILSELLGVDGNKICDFSDHGGDAVAVREKAKVGHVEVVEQAGYLARSDVMRLVEGGILAEGQLSDGIRQSFAAAQKPTVYELTEQGRAALLKLISGGGK